MQVWSFRSAAITEAARWRVNLLQQRWPMNSTRTASPWSLAMFTPFVGVPMQSALDLCVVWSLYGLYFWPCPKLNPVDAEEGSLKWSRQSHPQALTPAGQMRTPGSPAGLEPPSSARYLMTNPLGTREGARGFRCYLPCGRKHNTSSAVLSLRCLLLPHSRLASALRMRNRLYRLCYEEGISTACHALQLLTWPESVSLLTFSWHFVDGRNTGSDAAVHGPSNMGSTDKTPCERHCLTARMAHVKQVRQKTYPTYAIFVQAWPWFGCRR